MQNKTKAGTFRYPQSVLPGSMLSCTAHLRRDGGIRKTDLSFINQKSFTVYAA
jgi:hypothetical protein